MSRFEIRSGFAGVALSLIGFQAQADEYASSASPLSFGPDQAIIDFRKITWSPLELAGFAPGAEIAVLRGDLAYGSELILRVPSGYLIPNHNHTSDETYIWLSGEFTYINGADGRAAAMSEQGFISLPGSASPHAIRCGADPCVFYLRYSRAFDHAVYPMPAKIEMLE